jgi:hypothetical protein
MTKSQLSSNWAFITASGKLFDLWLGNKKTSEVLVLRAGMLHSLGFTSAVFIQHLLCDLIQLWRQLRIAYPNSG